MKRIFSIFICISMLVMTMSGLNLVAFASLAGEGTETNPYVITTAEEFIANLSGDKTGTYYEIRNDIELPDSYAPKIFAGNIRGAEKSDGGKYKIIAQITYSNNYAGIFATFAGEFSNLEIAGSVTSTGAEKTGALAGQISTESVISDCINSAVVTSSGKYTGGFVGSASNVSFEKCVNNASVSGDLEWVGGITGYSLGSVSYTNCENKGTITEKYNGTPATNDKYNGVGGITSYMHNNDSISNCVNSGDIYYSSVTNHNNAYVGGIAGWYRYGKLEKSVNKESAEIKITRSDDAATAMSVGGIAGQMGTGSITECKNYGTVTGLQKTTNYVGGIVGNTSGTITKSANLSDTVTGFYAGGIVGRQAGGTTSLSYNTGNIAGTDTAGGIVARQDANTTITNCFNIGNIGGTKSGGLTCFNRGTISNSYTVCNGTMTYGVTYEQTGTLSNVYYALNDNGSLSSSTQYGTLATIDELIANTTVFSSANGWTVLAIDDTNKYPLPQLTANPYYEAYTIPETEKENTTDYAGGFGTEDKPYLIENATHFANIVKNDAQGVYFKLNKDNIEISTPVAALNGIFDGNNKTINLNIDTTETKDASTGLFAKIMKTATVKNLVIEGCVKGTAKVGAVTGDSSDATASLKSTIENVINKADVSGQTAGGIVGDNYSNILRCANYGNVSSIGAAGGIAGQSSWKIEKSYNTGRISTTSGSATSAGIAANLRNESAYIDTCYNIGTVTGINAVGIAGSYLANTSIIKVSNTFSAGAVIRKDDAEPVIRRANDSVPAPVLSNVYYLTAKAFDDGYDNSSNITTLSELSALDITGFTKGGTYPVITENPESELNGIIKLSVTDTENGTTTLYNYGSLKERFIKAGEEVFIIVTPDNGYMAEITANGISVKSDIISQDTYIFEVSDEDTDVTVTYSVRPATDPSDIKITVTPMAFVPAVVTEGEEYTIKNQDGEYTVKAGVKYTAVFSKVNEYYGWGIGDYDFGIEINGRKYPSKLTLTDKLSFGIVVESVPSDAVIKSYVTYYEIKNPENKITVYSDVATAD